MLAYGTSKIVYIDNKTNIDIENICVTHGGKVAQNHKIKIIKAKPVTAPFTRKTIQLINDFFDNIGIKIINVKEDSELEIKVSEHFKG